MTSTQPRLPPNHKTREIGGIGRATVSGEDFGKGSVAHQNRIATARDAYMYAVPSVEERTPSREFTSVFRQQQLGQPRHGQLSLIERAIVKILE